MMGNIYDGIAPSMVKTNTKTTIIFRETIKTFDKLLKLFINNTL